MIISDEQLIAFLERRIWSVETWLDDHGPRSKRPWPDHIVEAKRDHLLHYRALVARIGAREQAV